MPDQNSSPPHIVIGIDFGHTHTGVAYTCLGAGHLQEPSVIHQWEGKLDEVINKVPTRLTYRGRNSSATGWGFNLKLDRPSKNKRANKVPTIVVEHFKLHLDEKILIAAHEQEQLDLDEDDEPEEYDSSTHNDAKQAYEDYLRNLYEWIRSTLENEGYDWEECKVEFIFSVPTTWNHTVVELYESIIERAGYERVTGHTSRTGFTEAEAAAVYTAVFDATGAINEDETEKKARRYEIEDILLVCDAGGGTTDVSALEVKNFRHGIPQMDELGPVNGDYIGSVDIDHAFEALIVERLQGVTASRSEFFDRNEAASKMAQGDFQHYKVHFGEASADLLSFNLEVPGMDDRDNWPAPAHISGGQMKFTKAELQKLFDDVIKRICKLIDETLKNISQDYPNRNVKHLILSGGLGSSEYVRQRLEERYIEQVTFDRDTDQIEHFTFNNTQGLKLLVAKDPRLVVCRGLVLGRIQDSYDISVIRGRCCRAWYGITYDEPWDRNKHGKDVETFQNKHDKQWYVPGKICWILEKGAFIEDSMPPSKAFRQSLSYRGSSKWVNHRIVQYDLRKAPPDRIGKDTEDIHTVCRVRCNLAEAIQEQGADLDHVEVQKRHHIMGRGFGKRFYVVDYDIKLKIGHADLKPELWFDGQERSHANHINVDWKTERRVIAQEAGYDPDYEPASYQSSIADSGYNEGSSTSRFHWKGGRRSGSIHSARF